MSTTSTKSFPPTILSLAPEVTDIIIEELLSDTILDNWRVGVVSLVCKALRKRCCRLTFRDVDIKKGEKFRRFLALLSNNRDLGAYVRHFRLECEGEWRDWATELSMVAHQLSHLYTLRVACRGVDSLGPVWSDVSADLQDALISFLTSPSLRTLSLGRHIYPVLPPRLLFSAPALEEIEFQLPKPPPGTIYDEEHWKKLDADYTRDGFRPEEPPRQPPALTSLVCHPGSNRPYTWISHIEAMRPTYFANLTDLVLTGISPKTLADLQALLIEHNSRLQHLDLRFAVEDEEFSSNIDLSRNTGLQRLACHYAYTNMNPRIGAPTDSVSFIKKAISTLNAPSLCEINLEVHWECGKDTPATRLSGLYNRIRDMSLRHPRLEVFDLYISVLHRPPCNRGNSPTCWPRNSIPAAPTFQGSSVDFTLAHRRWRPPGEPQDHFQSLRI